MRPVFVTTDFGLRFGPVRIAESTWERTRGLLCRPPLAVGEGMLIQRCRSVHTVGMRYAIDVVFIDNTGCVQGVRERLLPLRFAFCPRARHALELAEGQARDLGLTQGVSLSGCTN